MHIHRLEKFWIVLSLLLILGFIGTVFYGVFGMNMKVVGNEGGTVDPMNLQETPFGQPGVRTVNDEEVAVYVVARQFMFQPGTGQPIEVPAGREVTFYITAADVLHGFEVVGTNLNTMAIPGQVSKFTTVFPETGSYGIVCNEYCGLAHHVMEGRIEVVPPAEFESPGGG